MTTPSIALIIPARLASTRFPGKPLALIREKPMIQRVWEIAHKVSNLDPSKIFITTDNSQIQVAAKAFGAQVLITPETCQNGTERVYAALLELPQQPDWVINLQGDAVLTPPWLLENLIQGILTASKKQSVEFLTLAIPTQNPAPGETLVVLGPQQKALYFSRSTIPNLRKPSPGFIFYRHVGIYAYTPKVLQTFCKLYPKPLEQAEQLEQLRALEHGLDISVITCSLRGRSYASVDHPDDVAKVEKILDEEGELF